MNPNSLVPVFIGSEKKNEIDNLLLLASRSQNPNQGAADRLGALPKLRYFWIGPFSFEDQHILMT